MRRSSVLLGLMLTAALLAGCLSVLRKDIAPAQEESANTDTAAYWMLYEKPLSDFRTLSVTLADGESYSVTSSMVYDDQTGMLMGVMNNLGQPVTVDGQESFALNSTAYQMMLLTAQYLPVTARYESLDREACGLASPDARLRLTYADGSMISLSIGHLTASGTSCYVCMDGDSAVYLVPFDFHQVMTLPLNDQHRLPGALSEEAASAVQLALDGTSDGRIIATNHTGEGLILPWQVDTPISHSGSTERIQALIEGICAIYAESYVGTANDMDGLAEYGLDTPIRLVVSFQDGTIRDIHIGNDAGEGRVYVRMDVSGDIYCISRSQLAFFDDAALDSLLDRYVALIPINRLLQVTITTQERDTVLTQEWADAEAESAERFLVNGEEILQQDFSNQYAAIVGLQFDQSAPSEAAQGSLIAQVRFDLRDGSTEWVTYYEYDHHYNLVETSGGGRFLIRHERVDEMLSAQKLEQP